MVNDLLDREGDWRVRELQERIDISSNMNRIRQLVSLPSTTSLRASSIPPAKDGQTKFSCTACGKVYQHRQSLYNHVSYQCGREPQFACPYCQYRSRHKVNLKRHIATIHMVGFREQLGDLINSQATAMPKK
ncbi:longitudinals lacking protein, isoforms A/B/D/L-like [Rhodnius prolixus]|uniref:longitudinals lacking protein, isoforms A/B/D/L-like n=1 Tax=Rhodnius prolixus TaxID=13249 RepID=UPI003D18887A